MPVFPPFHVPHRTQEILKRSCLSQGVVFWSKIRYRGSKRQSEYSRREYIALPVVQVRPFLYGQILQTRVYDAQSISESLLFKLKPFYMCGLHLSGRSQREASQVTPIRPFSQLLVQNRTHLCSLRHWRYAAVRDFDIEP